MNKAIDITNVELTTERLKLRAWRESDIDDFFEYASVEGVGEMAGWPHHRSIEDSRNVLGMFIREKNTFAIEFEGKVIGSLGVDEYSTEELPEFEDMLGREIGFVLAKPYWGKGIMPEAVRRVMKWLFEDEKLDFIACGHFTDNMQSARVQEKCGFRHYKLIKYETRYGIVKDCWLSVMRREEFWG